jgi:hypothetical protein
MKTRLALTAALLSFLLVWPSTEAKPSKCTFATLRFACPEGFKSLPLESQQSFALFHQKKYGVGLFIASPESSFDEPTFITKVTRTTLAKMFPKESQKYAWKPVDFSGSVSKFEIGGGMARGFNGSQGVLIKYRHLQFNGKEIIIGYAAEFGRGLQGKESFDRGLGGDSMPGCYAAVDVIYSITGEKMPDDNPCDLVVKIR